ncbi:amino acid ABC transporter permease [Streptomyces sp. NPDC021093]|uniref:amino acid ABC transporter permease n=1 Tax=Streptomyces sp. NPDC021093 TaxID=3365112 RepID=UPI0037BDF7D0
MSGLPPLYDSPGPRTRRRHALLAVVFVLALALALAWVAYRMAGRHQLDADKWSPFVTDVRVWTEFLLPGLRTTVEASALAMSLSLPLGALLAVARLSSRDWLRRTTGSLTDLLRAVPVLLLMLLANEAYARFSDVSPDTRPFYAVVTGLVLFNAAVLAEIVRAGILALPAGQADAARAVGMREYQVMALVLLPQAVTAMLPALASQLVVVVKDTALGSEMLGFGELLHQARLIAANYGANTIACLTVVAALFIALNFLLTTLAARTERFLRTRVR